MALKPISVGRGYRIMGACGTLIPVLGILLFGRHRYLAFGLSIVGFFNVVHYTP
jgi:hypothetical protein